jgi:hypothetical protein
MAVHTKPNAEATPSQEGQPELMMKHERGVTDLRVPVIKAGIIVRSSLDKY